MTGSRDHGPLPGLLLALTIGTGLVDAVSYLTLGHVFVANMTGNIVFFGFAVAGAGGVSWSATLVAVGCFGAGAFVGGRHGSTRTTHRGRLLAVTCGAQCVLVAVTALLAAFADPTRRGTQLAMVALPAVAMGAQNAVVRRLAVPDLTTTVLTLTAAGLFADRTSNQVRLRRVASILAMMTGALVGGLLLRHGRIAAPLWAAAAVLAGCAVTADRLRRRDTAESWS
ncbi:YoaK family protein [Streptomyces fuscichromogenes]|uniref:Membrane protein n=1 Tax=Streptomyces fuscichromogenes TaxID=1324013 RepID=A0A917UJ83_9ACTN|nr:YoaK family protein [Streptomyces fuscichromogenes]GGM97016.1 membrane protein [Streptomyces fuscichromogenes]